jgi:hypothetical protein
MSRSYNKGSSANRVRSDLPAGLEKATNLQLRVLGYTPEQIRASKAGRKEKLVAEASAKLAEAKADPTKLLSPNGRDTRYAAQFRDRTLAEGELPGFKMANRGDFYGQEYDSYLVINDTKKVNEAAAKAFSELAKMPPDIIDRMSSSKILEYVENAVTVATKGQSKVRWSVKSYPD